MLGAAYVRGYSGFGFSAIFIAFASLLMNPLPLIAVVYACEILMTVFQAGGIRGHVDWRRAITMLAGASLILPISVWALVSIGDESVRIVVSLIVLVMSLILLAGWTTPNLFRTRGNLLIGMVAGLCNGAGVGGLPVAAAMTAQPIPAPVFRATMIVFLTGIDIISTPLLWMNGLISWDTAYAMALAFPMLGVGVWLGSRRFQSASPTTFRRFAIYLLLTLATLGLMRSVI